MFDMIALRNFSFVLSASSPVLRSLPGAAEKLLYRRSCFVVMASDWTSTAGFCNPAAVKFATIKVRLPGRISLFRLSFLHRLIDFQAACRASARFGDPNLAGAAGLSPEKSR